MKIKDLLLVFTEVADLSLQASYDNSGLLIGSADTEVNQVLLAIDVTEAVIEEAIQKKCELIIAHHPLIFKGLKRIGDGNLVERTVTAAIKNSIAVAAMHTNLDNIMSGVNGKLASKLGITKCKILSASNDTLKKLSVFCPVAQADQVRSAMFESGAGHIGAYDSCSFNISGKGTFRGAEQTNPFVGQIGQLHQEDEIRIETIVPEYLINKVVNNMIAVHPYEEVAYDIYPLDNRHNAIGSGLVGELESAMDELDFLNMIQEKLGTAVLKHTSLTGKKVQRIAICGGSGAFLLNKAKSVGADVFVTADLKYHDFFEADGKLLVVDAGHFETEQFTKELMAEMIQKKIPNFAALISEVDTNAVRYFRN
ncbi:MAG: Nif3-like dinuclear metal center hexameric protein [Bacteroidales bacterium]|jgi:dinuclear metal center YbgI/SA1388 family protein|nr:Nif3-like dinuclear metal center hexameric protein [Bacteroidales bacterium]